MSGLYSALDPDRREIRLLEICPNEDEENPIQGILRVVSLDDSPNFEALSYAWGDITELTNLTINDCPFGISKSLAVFLLRLRQPTETRVVWVDFVCINQLDVLEKNTQVPLMSDIYKNASRVIAWLGELSNPNIEDTVAYNDAMEGRHTLRSEYWLDLGDKITLTERERQALYDALVRVLDGCHDLLVRPYWKRLWTFQEWHLPKNEPLCLCGKLSFKLGNLGVYLSHSSKPFSPMYQWFAIMDIAWRLSEKRKSEREDDGSEMNLQPRLQSHDVWLKRLEEVTLIVPMDLIAPHFFRKHDHCDNTLTGLVLATISRQCSHPHDRVYALYGMAPKAQQMFPPDYKKSMDQVMREATAFMMNYESAEAFQFFDLCCSKSLPSWTLSIDKMDLLRVRHVLNNLCVNSKPKKTLYSGPIIYAPRVSNDLSTLHIGARPLGRITSSSRLPSEPADLLSSLDASDTDSHSKDGEGVARHPLLSAVYNYTKWTSPLSMSDFVELIKSSKTKTRDSFLAEVQEMIYKKALLYDGKAGASVFWIDCGAAFETVGIAECDAQNGDQLILPCGIGQVFIIRECPDTHDDVAMHYKIVGRAYVEGIGEELEFQITTLIERLEEMPFEEYFIC
ncbi:HET-domain-containing protein [Aspergillus sclerotioniger CBS 115572]|uniref:HET-domain-containing protein n=1 Tax=Aspergillus sclerotioniger CBS 115572 TaxID=1450535 RepID=A0A317X0V3_9EURO|nr:HET-domain-containing protein [Aspergillus sclerotioniger CBS 115572]PWY90588.1 HET-domain-containing protein [Aspergillus sclerotioniger CBS 115572]